MNFELTLLGGATSNLEFPNLQHKETAKQNVTTKKKQRIIQNHRRSIVIHVIAAILWHIRGTSWCLRDLRPNLLGLRAVLATRTASAGWSRPATIEELKDGWQLPILLLTEF
jgi:hypothetical protein